VCAGAPCHRWRKPREGFGQAAYVLDQRVHDHHCGAAHGLIGGRRHRVTSLVHPRLLDGRVVGMMRRKAPPQRRVIRVLDRFQGGPAREDITD
jgi:hypothetical protein